MQNQDTFYPMSYEMKSVSGGYTITSGTNSTHRRRYFAYTGFSTPVGRKFVDATSGTYGKAEYHFPQGEMNFYSRSTGSPSWTDHTRFSGALGGSYGTRLFSSFSSGYDSNIYNDALGKFYDRVKLTESNLALTIGEARESGRMLKVGKSIAEVLTIARRAKNQFLRNPSKSLSQIWLSYKYGWQPLLTDVYNYLNWTYTSFNEGIPVSAKRNVKRKIFDSLGSANSAQGMSVVTGLIQNQAEIKCWIGLADTDAYNLSRITSLSPLSIAWELVPLSFVADWFVDIGGYLALQEAALGAGVSFKRGYTTEVSYHNLVDTHYQDYPTSSGGQDYWTVGSRKSMWIQALKRRDRLYSLPFPRTPVLKVNLGSSRIISSAALLRVILLGKVR